MRGATSEVVDHLAFLAGSCLYSSVSTTVFYRYYCDCYHDNRSRTTEWIIQYTATNIEFIRAPSEMREPRGRGGQGEESSSGKKRWKRTTTSHNATANGPRKKPKTTTRPWRRGAFTSAGSLPPEIESIINLSKLLV